MNILVVGNGFDLAHKLPTKYMDFLEFVNAAKKDFNENFSTASDQIECILSVYRTAVLKPYILKCKGSVIDNEMYEITRNIFSPKEKSEYDELLKSFFNKNLWLDYFNGINKSEIGENWIDFEAEIFKVVLYLEEYKIGKTNELAEDDVLKKFSWPELYLLSIEDPKERQIELKKIKDVLYGELEIFISFLELYMLLINKMPKFLKFPVIMDYGFDKILSFNYTDIYTDIYHKYFDKRNFEFIHGEAGEENLVLGSEETLYGNDINNEIFCIQFKKYFQRIYKKTGLKYKGWLAENPSRGSRHSVSIIGHSLDTTDGDALNYIITHPNVGKTTIFYHDEEAHARYIANLVKIIGKDEMIKRTGNINIVLEKQPDMIPV